MEVTHHGVTMPTRHKLDGGSITATTQQGHCPTSAERFGYEGRWADPGGVLEQTNMPPDGVSDLFWFDGNVDVGSVVVGG